MRRGFSDDVKLMIDRIIEEGQCYSLKQLQVTGIDVMDAFEYMSKTVRMIKDNHLADVIIGVYHGGFERDLETGELTEDDTGENQAYRMVKEIEGLDILITGHQHRSIATKCFNTYVCNYRCLGC